MWLIPRKKEKSWYSTSKESEVCCLIVLILMQIQWRVFSGVELETKKKIAHRKKKENTIKWKQKRSFCVWNPNLYMCTCQIRQEPIYFGFIEDFVLCIKKNIFRAISCGLKNKIKKKNICKSRRVFVVNALELLWFYFLKGHTRPSQTECKILNGINEKIILYSTQTPVIVYVRKEIN